MNIQTICVCGAGTMGSGIAQVAAQSGFRTILYELNETVLQKARISIDNSLQSQVDKGRMNEEAKNKTLAHLSFTSDYRQCIADLFIEAIVENPAIKISLFNQLATINSKESIFASNTSSLSITDIAEKIQNPERVIGMHFFNPAPVMKLVEVISTSHTHASATEKVDHLVRTFGKTPVHCKDSPGFIVNRVARPYYIEALRLAEENVASIEVIDQLLQATGFRMGPFQLMDLIGNDINYAVSCSLYEALGEPARLKPSWLQEEKVKEGKLGKKTGEGFYRHSPSNNKIAS